MNESTYSESAPGIAPQLLDRLNKRLGPAHARQRLNAESSHDQQVFGGGLNFFHPENWYSLEVMIRATLKVSGFYNHGVKNARNHIININQIRSERLPKAFDGFTLLHLSDLHVDMDPTSTHALIEKLLTIDDYDACILTGDYRARTYGSFEQTIHGMQKVVPHLKQPIYAVLGNHDSIQMVPALEDMGIQLLLNEHVLIRRNNEHLFLAGIDDAHFFRVDNIEKAAQDLRPDQFSILLSHTPEVYRQAAHADFDLMLSGHTHGGQICLPGGFPITLDSNCPRWVGKGPWQYGKLTGYTSVGCGTSVVNVRFNCPPEITLHRLLCC